MRKVESCCSRERLRYKVVYQNPLNGPPVWCSIQLDKTPLEDDLAVPLIPKLPKKHAQLLMHFQNLP